MVEKLEREQLQKITLHNSSIQWYKKNKEIVINSTLFDVKSYTLGGDSTTFTGLFDEEETVLKRQVRKMFEQQDNNRPERVGFAKLVLQLWDFVNFRINIESAELRYLAVNPDNRNAHLISTFIFVPLPPPRV